MSSFNDGSTSGLTGEQYEDMLVAEAAELVAASEASQTSALATHNADTTSVHGISDTSVLATDAEVASAVSTHAALTTSVHGVDDFSLLEPISRVYDVEKSPYNAVPDDFYTDAVVTSASTTLTSATANFTAADIGKTIIVLKGGPSSHQDHHTTIASVTNSTTAVMANAAERSQSSARLYISRSGAQTTAIQAAIDAAATAGGGTVVLPGVGYLTGQLILKNRVHLKGGGHRSTCLHLTHSTTGAVIKSDTTANSSSMHLHVSDMWIDGARARQTGTVTTTLASGYTAGSSTSLSLTDASSFAQSGSVLIGTNRLHYESKTGNTLNTVLGGREATTDANASAGATVTQYPNHGIHFEQVPFNDAGTFSETFDPRNIVERCIVKNVKGDGVHLRGLSDCRVSNVWVEYAEQFGFRPSFDSFIDNCTVSFTYRAGFYIFGASAAVSNSKAFYCGFPTSEGHGFLIEGPKTLEEGCKVLSSCTAQDNKAHGFYLRTAQRVIIQGAASSNSAGSAGTYAGVKIEGCTLGVIDIVCTERKFDGVNNNQTNAIEVLDSPDGNILSGQMRCRITHGAAGTATVGTAIKSGSVLTGGIDLVINGMGGVRNTTFAASLTVDPYLATTHMITQTANITAVNAPTNAHYGCPLEFHFIQDGTGGRTLATGVWNSVFKFTGNTAPTITTTANFRNIIRFVYNGTNWVETGRALGVGG